MSFAFNIPFKVERKPAWVNPYVTDGLVAMWDGEWNAGLGVHDASATEWKDLAGNLDLGVVGSQTPLWGDNSLTIKSKIFESFDNLVLSGSLTVEFVASFGENRQNEGFGFWGVGLSGRSPIGFNSSLRTNGYYWSYPRLYTKENNGVGGGPNYGLSSHGQVYYWWKYDSDSSLWNGGAKTTGWSNSGFSSTIPNGTINGKFEIGYVSGTPDINPRLYTLRIYNRVLTDDEFSKNRELDFERFWP